MMASVTSSYFAPPMPWMKPSERQTRKNIVVVNARLRRSRVSEISPGLAISYRGRGVLSPLGGVIARIRALPEHVAIADKVRDRMIAAADMIPSAIFADTLVVNGMEARQIADDVPNEALERLRFAHTAQGNLEVSTVPAALPETAGGRNDFAQHRRPLVLPAHFGPHFGQ